VYRPTNGYWIIRNSSGGISTPLMGDPTQGDIAVEASPYYMTPAYANQRGLAATSFSGGTTAHAFAANSAPATNVNVPLPTGWNTKSKSLWKFGTDFTA